MGTLLIVTCGTTDLQFIVETENGPARVPVEPKTQRQLHEALVEGRLGYVIDAEGESVRFEPTLRLKADCETGVRLIREAPNPPGAPQEGAVPLPLRIVPGKLSGLRNMGETLPRPDAVIVLNTNRTRKPDEPIAAGKLLADWLARVFGLEQTRAENQARRGGAGWLDYLTGEMEAEDADGGPVNRRAVARIDAALNDLSRQGEWDNVILAIAGGIPGYRDEVRAAARFRFPAATFLEYRQQRKASAGSGGEVSRINDAMLPSELFRVRRQVRSLIRRGDFFGAGVLADLYPDQPWSVPVGTVVRYLNDQPLQSASLPPYLMGVSAASAPRCLLAAFRTEIALRSGRTAEALLWTFTFADAALIDGILRLPFVQNGSYDGLKRRFRRVAGTAIPSHLLTDDGNGSPLKWGGDWVGVWTAPKINDRWFAELGQLGTHLARFRDGLQSRVGRESGMPSPGPISELRNLMVHSALPKRVMDEIATVFLREKLWATDRADGFCFLRQEPVTQVLTELGVQGASGRFSTIVSELVACVEAAADPSSR